MSYIIKFLEKMIRGQTFPILLFFYLLFFETGSCLCGSGWPGIIHEAQVGLKLWQPSCLSLLSAGDYNHELPYRFSVREQLSVSLGTLFCLLIFCGFYSQGVIQVLADGQKAPNLLWHASTGLKPAPVERS